MAYLVVGVIGNVLRLVPIQNFKRSGVARSSRIDPSKFVVLAPKIGLDQFGSSQELEYRDITSCEGLAASRCQSLSGAA